MGIALLKLAAIVWVSVATAIVVGMFADRQVEDSSAWRKLTLGVLWPLAAMWFLVVIVVDLFADAAAKRKRKARDARDGGEP